MKLTKAQKRALLHLKQQEDWVNDTPVTQKCLNILAEKGLVKVAFDPSMGWCERLTKQGKVIAACILQCPYCQTTRLYSLTKPIRRNKRTCLNCRAEATYNHGRWKWNRILAHVMESSGKVYDKKRRKWVQRY